MNRILKFASLSVVAVALPFAWRVGVFGSAQQKESKHFEMLAKECGIENYYVREGFFRDQVELSPEFKEVEQQVARLAAEELKRSGSKGMGVAQEYGQLKKRLFKERYRIEWRPLEEMNPFVIFD